MPARRAVPARGPIGHLDERGAGSVLGATIALGLVGFMVLALWGIGWVTSVHRASRIADLAALAGATAHASGGDACAAARETALRNGGALTGCTIKGDRASFVLLVETTTPLRPVIRLAGAPRHALGVAAAGPARPR